MEEKQTQFKECFFFPSLSQFCTRSHIPNASNPVSCVPSATKHKHHPMRQILSLAFPQQKDNKSSNTQCLKSCLSPSATKKNNTQFLNSSILSPSSGCNTIKFTLFLLFLIFLFLFLCTSRSTNHFNKTNSSFLFRVHKSYV